MRKTGWVLSQCLVIFSWTNKSISLVLCIALHRGGGGGIWGSEPPISCTFYSRFLPPSLGIPAFFLFPLQTVTHCCNFLLLKFLSVLATLGIPHTTLSSSFSCNPSHPLSFWAYAPPPPPCPLPLPTLFWMECYSIVGPLPEFFCCYLHVTCNINLPFVSLCMFSEKFSLLCIKQMDHIFPWSALL